ncbi:hypothetical protein C8R46DRAFT_1212487 [Mycena filopes]|nr:hypothetical protein C8R46DRAFT_1212487 [Mycena filopes]
MSAVMKSLLITSNVTVMLQRANDASNDAPESFKDQHIGVKYHPPLSFILESLLTFPINKLMLQLRANALPVLYQERDTRAVLASIADHLASLPRHPPCEVGTLSKYISSLSSLLAPIRQLPPEILQMIFVNILTHPFSCIGAQRRVAGVCHHWRKIALDTPDFWGTFVVSLSGGQNIGAIETLRLHISRSKQRALFIHILYDHHSSIDKAALADLLKCAERWAHISIPHGLSLEHFAATHDRLLSLRSFAYEGEWHLNPLGRTLQAFLAAPNLHAIDLALSNLSNRGDGHGMEHMVPPPPLTRLALLHFKGGHTSIRRFVERFRCSLYQLVLHNIKLRARDLLALLRSCQALNHCPSAAWQPSP